jgi:biopolymer transport protein ExbB
VYFAVAAAAGCSDDGDASPRGGGTGGTVGSGGSPGTGGAQTGGSDTGGGGAGETGGTTGTGGEAGGTTSDGGTDVDVGSGPSKPVKLDTTPAGANVMGDVPKYPVPIVLTAANFDFAQAMPNGADIRFSSDTGTPLPFSIELWDSAAKVAALWVKVDVKGNSTQTIKLRWGNAGAPGAADSHAVFDTADGFAGVWHLGEPGSTTAGGYKDATSNAADAVGVAMAADATGDGRVGKAALLTHSKKQWIQVPLDKSTLFDMPDKMTYSLWIKANSHSVAYQCMFSKGEGSFRIHYVGTASEYGGKNIVETCAEGTENGDLCPVNPKGTDVAPGKWWHLVAIHDRPKHSIWVNGAKEAGVDDDGEVWKSDPAKMVMIGNNSSATGRSFDGWVDEARIMNVAKDENWIKLEYESQREEQKFVTVGP